MQIQLSFMVELPITKTSVWDQLDEDQKAVVIESVARLVVKMILADSHQEPNNDR